jgi:hypothetical protein
MTFISYITHPYTPRAKACFLSLVSLYAYSCLLCILESMYEQEQKMTALEGITVSTFAENKFS